MGMGEGCVCLWEAKAILGESTLWDHRDGCIYWVDIDAPSVNWFNLATGEKHSWTPPQWISAIALRERGGFVASCADGFAYLDPASRSTSHSRIQYRTGVSHG